MFSKKLVSSKLILSLFLLLSIAGCASKPSNPEISSGGSTPPAPSTSQNAKPVGTGTEAKAGEVTYENYLKIKLDSTYDDVKSILGEGRKTATNSPDVFSYNWGESGKTINIQINKGKVEAKTQTMLGKTTSSLTEDQFNKVTKGMSFDQVVSILGPDYQESSYKKSANAVRRVVTWMRPDSTNVTIGLEDNKVFDKYNFLK